MVCSLQAPAAGGNFIRVTAHRSAPDCKIQERTICNVEDFSEPASRSEQLHSVLPR